MKKSCSRYQIVMLLLTISTTLLAHDVEKWKIFEVVLEAESDGNPFLETVMEADFYHAEDTIGVKGFYDGSNQYKLRFMPIHEGEWTYQTSSNHAQLNDLTGSFFCKAPTPENHGPVIVKDTFDFAYADGTPHYSFGTTCYGWVHQGDEMANKTLKTLANGYFNKMRMCIFPKHYDWNKNEPLLYPFAGDLSTGWDYTTLNPAYFRNIEKRIADLDALGIEADLIIYHPYDRWGFDSLDRTTENLYMDYLIARFAAYKNVWWSMANEYDFMKNKTAEDWNYFIDYFHQNDPYDHLLGIHNGHKVYDHSNPKLTHCSIQGYSSLKSAKDLRAKYGKPVVYDEVQYEGNIHWSWGNLSGEEMVQKFWMGFMYGSHVGHGECYVTEQPLKDPKVSNDALWWSKGGTLKGESPERIRFLRKIIEEGPAHAKTQEIKHDWMYLPARQVAGEYYLIYLERRQPRIFIYDLPSDHQYKIEIIDTWNMTIETVQNRYSGRCLVELPGRANMALRISKI